MLTEWLTFCVTDKLFGKMFYTLLLEHTSNLLKIHVLNLYIHLKSHKHIPSAFICREWGRKDFSGNGLGADDRSGGVGQTLYMKMS